MALLQLPNQKQLCNEHLNIWLEKHRLLKKMLIQNSTLKDKKKLLKNHSYACG
jgi:hypothetical protein